MTSDHQQLLAAAARARQNAYAPYSNFKVGAALLTETGEIFTGCNVENASYGLSMCAERTAVFKAVAEGQRSFKAIAISLTSDGSPCGACRQVLHEFAPNLLILIGDDSGQLTSQTTLDALLPNPFGPNNLT
ncbi:MAG: cytidine deaminase [Verrucomicrobiota bacterium]